MRKGSVPRSIVLPTSSIEPHHAPDGLTESDIDALIAEVTTEVKPARPRPGWLSSDPAETRRSRHKARQVVRYLPTVLKAAGHIDATDDEAA
jgi:hypothetical protein